MRQSAIEIAQNVSKRCSFGGIRFQPGVRKLVLQRRDRLLLAFSEQDRRHPALSGRDEQMTEWRLRRRVVKADASAPRAVAGRGHAEFLIDRAVELGG